ncbi:natural killer cell enhancement factor-like [Scleropages formosus]|uniref:Peroxiredoxin-2 n=1 Tax=Scleropages formosus TaxID=113540 RepID=A0A0P7WJH6_SCLFO|nr:natural killer cell enhancement factor-like [Scleropages formosus]
MSAGNAKIGQPAPQFKATAVVEGRFRELQLADYRGDCLSLRLCDTPCPRPRDLDTVGRRVSELLRLKGAPFFLRSGKYVVLFFYPLDFTFVCPTEIVAFSDRAEEFRSVGCEVLAASTDSHFSHLAWINTERKQGGLGTMNIPLIADLTKSISQDYGVLKEDEGIAYRGLFVIDDKGILRQITINDLPVGRSVDETLRLVQAFQHTDKFGEVCPAGWKPGSDTIIPDVQKSKEFFAKQD